MSDTARVPLEENFPTPTVDHVREATRRLVDAFDPLRIIVFGSYARGEAHPGSDLDLLVVLPEVDNKREAAIAMRHELAGLSVPKDVVVTTPDEIAQRHDSTWHIVGFALRDGKTVYQKTKEQ
jgi:predicted nucleotidyltransferase